jgi:hypothetical protein
VSGARYHNCFYYFRGPAPAGTQEQKFDLRERQFEDNTTKALVNVLEHGGLVGSFHEDLLGLPAPHSMEAPRFALQRTAHPEAGATRLLVGISTIGEVDPKSWAVAEQPASGRVDAEWRVGDVTVLLETKVVEFMDGPQLNRHAADWGIEEAQPGTDQLPTDWRLLTWAQVYRWADEQAAGAAAGGVPRFLAEQLREYLELTGLAPFSGWRQEHFDYFKLPEEARRAGEQIEVAEQIKTRLEGIWGVVKDLAPDTFARLGEIRVGRMAAQYDHAWAETHTGSGLPNLSLEIGATDLQLNLTSWDSAQAARFERWLVKAGAPSALRSLGDHELVVMRRRAKPDHKGDPYWMKAPYGVVTKVDSADVAADPAGLLSQWRAGTDPKWERLAYHLRRSWLPTEVAATGTSFVPTLIEAIDRLLPTLEEIQRA